MYYDFLTVFALLAAGMLFVSANMVIFSLFRPHKPNELKLSTYECGEEAFGSSWIRFDMRFYTVALIFVIFDLEIAFLFPWAAVFKDPAVSVVAVTEGLVFISILFLGLVYVWAKGDLDWTKAFSEGRAIMTGHTVQDFQRLRLGQATESVDVQVPAQGASGDEADGAASEPQQTTKA